ncbi:MAG: thioredoxin domain-containing protein [Janthinobacterium lividum]
MRCIFNIIILLALSSCSDEASFLTPAQPHIDEYMNGLKSCKDEQETQTSSSQSSSSLSLNVKADPSSALSNSSSKTPEDKQKTLEDEQNTKVEIQESPGADSKKDLNSAQSTLPKVDSNATDKTSNEPVQDKVITEPVKSVNLDINDNDIVLGNRNSKVVFIEYFSPTCPHCAYYHKNIFPAIKKKYIDTNKVAYIIREFVGNKQDLDAAILARCKGDDDSFIKFANVILQQQESWSLTNKYREILTNIGQLGGISPEKYSKCLGDNKLAELLITNSKIAAKSPKFIGTPAFFVNGLQFGGTYSVDGISEIIDQKLSQN